MKYIFQTWKSHDLTSANPIFELSRMSWQKMHPEWEYAFFDDAEIDETIKSHFPRFYHKYFRRYNGQIKRVDLFRYCNLFLKGGVYSDLDGECLHPLDEIYEYSEDHFFGSLKNEQSPNRFPNALMISKRPYGHFWLFVLAMACERFEKNRGYYSTEYLTGPILLTSAILEYKRMSPQQIFDFSKRYLPDYPELAVRGSHEKDTVRVFPNHIFYPIDWLSFNESERQKIVADRLEEGEIPKHLLSSDSLTMNYWTHSWDVPSYSLSERFWLRIRYHVFMLKRLIKANKRGLSSTESLNQN